MGAREWSLLAVSVALSATALGGCAPPKDCGPATTYTNRDSERLVEHAPGDQFRIALRFNDLSEATTWLVGLDGDAVSADGKPQDNPWCHAGDYLPTPEPSSASPFDFTAQKPGRARITLVHVSGRERPDAGGLPWLRPDGGADDDAGMTGYRKSDAVFYLDVMVR